MKHLLLILLAGTLTACSSMPFNYTAHIPLDDDPRIGERVAKACFVHSIQGFNQVRNDDRAVIVRFRQDEQYKLTLEGNCDPEWARRDMLIESCGQSNCILEGHRVALPGDDTRAFCRISKIEKWDPNAHERRLREQVAP